jgi:hypothetical protein
MMFVLMLGRWDTANLVGLKAGDVRRASEGSECGGGKFRGDLGKERSSGLLQKLRG